MSDYGHDLLFGTFLTPSADAPDRVVALAQLTEQVGLDLVTFQDHPYQPKLLDAWTLLSFVAARTSTVRLAPNVANLPLRPPAVLARSAAALDLLSGGRVELGLGAGAFWDAIDAMGGRRLAPAERVQALAEAIEVIRQVWDTAEPGGVKVDGSSHRVVGAKRGPAPAHDIGIWLGAYKPRMLALTGRTADGWLPSLSYLQAGGLAAGNTAIDAAADEAGRPPAAIRRLLNISGEFQASGGALLHGPASQWVEELRDLALRDGVSAFILGTDSAEDIRRFAAEVAPAVSELVAAARAATAPPEPEARPLARMTAGPHARTAAAGRTPVRKPFDVVATPDHGNRLTEVRVWEESTRPTGPVPDPGRTYTERERATGQHLVDVHDALRAELAQVRSLIEQVASGAIDAASARSDINEMTMRQNKWTVGTYCQSYCRIVTTHHGLEDQAVFPRLRRADPRLADVVDRLESEHVAIHEVLEGVDRALVTFVSTADGTVALRAAVDLLSDALLSHLSYEERELVEPLARLGF